MGRVDSADATQVDGILDTLDKQSKLPNKSGSVTIESRFCEGLIGLVAERSGVSLVVRLLGIKDLWLKIWRKDDLNGLRCMHKNIFRKKYRHFGKKN